MGSRLSTRQQHLPSGWVLEMNTNSINSEFDLMLFSKLFLIYIVLSSQWEMPDGHVIFFSSFTKYRSLEIKPGLQTCNQCFIQTP